MNRGRLSQVHTECHKSLIARRWIFLNLVSKPKSRGRYNCFLILKSRYLLYVCSLQKWFYNIMFIPFEFFSLNLNLDFTIWLIIQQNFKPLFTSKDRSINRVFGKMFFSQFQHIVVCVYHWLLNIHWTILLCLNALMFCIQKKAVKKLGSLRTCKKYDLIHIKFL